MKTRLLGKTGLQVSVLGFGASPLGGVFGPLSQSEADRMVGMAVDAGINLFDVSPYYGDTLAETVLGHSLQTVDRSAIILATKVGRYGAGSFDFSAERVTRSVDESLARLQTDRIDIIQCHDIEFGSLRQIVEETLPALRALQQQGKVRFVGITGLPIKIFRTVLAETELDTVLSYCHHTLTDTLLDGLIPELASKSVGVLNAAPFGMGLLTGRDLPEWHPAPETLRSACRAAAEHCKKRGSEIAKVALQWSLQEESIASTFAGMGSVEQTAQNIAWANAELDRELAAELLEILQPVHNMTWPSGLPENND
jgi:L-galactose dehydrogenase